MQADIDEAVRIASLAFGFTWKWRTDDVEKFRAAAGWDRIEPQSPGPDMDMDMGFRTGLNIEFPVARACCEPAFFERRHSPKQQVKELLVRVSDRVDPNDSDSRRQLIDAFAEIADRLTTELRAPDQTFPGPRPSLRWTRARVVLTLEIGELSVALRIANPIYQRWWDELLAHEDDEDEDDFRDDEDEDLTELPDVPQTWEAFSDALALTMARLPGSGVLDIGSAETTVVMIDMDWDVIKCRITAGTGSIAGLGVSASERRAIDDNGWMASTAQANVGEVWERSLRWPAPYFEFQATADAIVAAMRAVLGSPNPTDVHVDAWIGVSDDRPDISAFGLR